MRTVPLRSDSAVMAEINITPFTDVLLVLLIIFVVLSAIVVPSGFQKSLPNGCACNTTPRPPLHAVNVDVDASGRITVDGRFTSESALYGALAAKGAADARTIVRFAADRHAPYRLAIRVLDAAKAAGLENVTFVTQ
jgi:biopolymer transport protein ExbD